MNLQQALKNIPTAAYGRRYQFIFGTPAKQVVKAIGQPWGGIPTPAPLPLPAEQSATELYNIPTPSGSSSTAPKELFSVPYSTKRTTEVSENFLQLTDEDGAGLHIESNISRKKDSGQNPTEATITIYNMDEEDVKLLSSPNAVVILKAGYTADLPNLPTIYSGDVKFAYTTQQGPDKVTTVVVEDGYVAKRTAKVSKTFTRNTSVADVIKSAVENFSGLSKGNIDTHTVQGIALSSGMVMYGHSSTMLQKICDSYGLLWNIKDGKINVLPKVFSKESSKFASMKQKAYLITPDLVKGSVELTYSKGKRTNANTEKTSVGVELFLSGGIAVGEFVKFEGHGSDVDGLYRIDTVTHNMSFRGTNWSTKIETEKL